MTQITPDTVRRTNAELAKYGGPGFKGGGPEIVLNSFTGSDIDCSIAIPKPERWDEYKQLVGLSEDYEWPGTKRWAEIETLTISSARSVSAVRRLGEYHAFEYTRGARTIAGSMVFTSFSRDVFAELYKLHPGENFSTSTGGSPPMHVDQIPPFHIIMTGVNEYGAIGQSLLLNVTLTNFGTTLSVHDLKTEATYTYVAQFYIPMVNNATSFIEQHNAIAAGQQALSTYQQNWQAIDPKISPWWTPHSMKAANSETQRAFARVAEETTKGTR